MYHLLAHDTVDGHLGSFQLWSLVNSAAINILEPVFWWTYIRISVGCTCRSGIPGFCDLLIFTIRYCHSIFLIKKILRGNCLNVSLYEWVFYLFFLNMGSKAMGQVDMWKLSELEIKVTSLPSALIASPKVPFTVDFFSYKMKIL